MGTTLPYLTIDLSDVFECSIMYTALNRGVSCDQMSVKGFKKEEMKTNLKVLVFDASIREEKYEVSTPD